MTYLLWPGLEMGRLREQLLKGKICRWKTKFGIDSVSVDYSTVSKLRDLDSYLVDS